MASSPLVMSLSVDRLYEIVLGLGYRKKVKDISLNLFCLLRGLKTSFLWDLGRPPSPSQLQQLRLLLGHQLVFLRLHGDLILALRTSLQTLLDRLGSDPPLLIDISDGVEPSLVLPPASGLASLSDVLERLLASGQELVELEPAPGQNVPCLFGLLLGFPLLYTFQSGEGASLGGRDLVLVQLEASWAGHSCITVSFSLPSSLWREEGVEAALEAWRSRLGLSAWGVGLHCSDVLITATTKIQNLPVVIL